MDLIAPEPGLVIFQLFAVAVIISIVVFFVRYFRRKSRILIGKEKELKNR